MEEEIDLLTWEAPEILRELYPYYHAGYDYENRPIWIAEIGRWNFRKIVEDGGDNLKNVENFVNQGFYHMANSIRKKMVDQGNEGPSAVVIFDFADYSLLTMTHMPTVCLLTRLTRIYLQRIKDLVQLIIILNANSVTRILVNFMKPVVGGLMDRVQVHGKKSSWIPHILKICPINQIPPCYGGSADYKPFCVYGLLDDFQVKPPLLLNRAIKSREIAKSNEPSS